MIACDEFLIKAKYIHSSYTSQGYSYSCKEMDYRECARTSYYYIYHKAYIRSLSINGNFSMNTGAHQRVIDKLLSSSDPINIKLAQLLIKLRPVRVHADYKLDDSFNKNDAYKTLREAEKIFSSGI